MPKTAHKPPQDSTRYTTIESPVGPLLLAGGDEGLSLISFQASTRAESPEPAWTLDATPFTQAVSQLQAYFAGELEEFDLPLSPRGTDFQLSVWAALRDIPFGETISYGELARRIGNPNASRAVGLANGSNPIPIIIPCHRVIGSNGKLTGYGGGLPIKEKLLALERKQLTLL